MVRESGIPATKPIFPSYLMPNFRLPFTNARRRSSADSAAFLSEDGSAPSTAQTTPNNSPPTHETHHAIQKQHQQRQQQQQQQPPRLARVQADTLRCGTCSTDLAFTSQIISKGFTGRYGRAFLVAPQSAAATGGEAGALLNMRVGRNENRQLVTGWHVVADISCGTCSTKLGWKYVDAKEPSQQYKVGKYILETERVVTFRSWEDVGSGPSSLALQSRGSTDVEQRRRRRKSADEEGDEEGDDEEEREVVFDSEDEDECEDVFAGTWDAEAVAKRRKSLVTRRRGTTG